MSLSIDALTSVLRYLLTPQDIGNFCLTSKLFRLAHNKEYNAVLAFITRKHGIGRIPVGLTAIIYNDMIPLEVALKTAPKGNKYYASCAFYFGKYNVSKFLWDRRGLYYSSSGDESDEYCTEIIGALRDGNVKAVMEHLEGNMGLKTCFYDSSRGNYPHNISARLLLGLPLNAKEVSRIKNLGVSSNTYKSYFQKAIVGGLLKNVEQLWHSSIDITTTTIYSALTSGNEKVIIFMIKQGVPFTHSYYATTARHGTTHIIESLSREGFKVDWQKMYDLSMKHKNFTDAKLIQERNLISK